MTSPHTLPEETHPRLRATQRAFDSVAADYDGERGNNALIQEMRTEMWRWLDMTFAPGSRLLDLGCGTGLGHQVTAVDWSPEMVRRTDARAAQALLGARVQALAVGAHELERLEAAGSYDGAYSNLGPLNCVPDLAAVAAQCARLLKSGGALVFTVIGRVCPWELAHYARRRRWARIGVRYARGAVPVGMNGETIWTRYYGPREFYRPFRQQFALTHPRSCVFAPPPYLTWGARASPADAPAAGTDRRSGWPPLRSLGDHFLIVMRALRLPQGGPSSVTSRNAARSRAAAARRWLVSIYSGKPSAPTVAQLMPAHSVARGSSTCAPARAASWRSRSISGVTNDSNGTASTTPPLTTVQSR
jgi:SAM-dependent methyltransferase